MKPEEIRTIALPIIYQIQNEKPNELMWIVEWAGVELCTRFLAAIPVDDTALQERLAQERERCAGICDRFHNRMMVPAECAAAIRSIK